MEKKRRRRCSEVMGMEECLKADRDRKRQHRIAATPDVRLAEVGPRPIDEATKARVYRMCSEALSNDAMCMDVCCVCDRLVLRTAMIRKKWTRGEAMQKAIMNRLKPSAAIPVTLVEQYSAACVDKTLKGVLLSPRGVLLCGGETWLQICKSCHTSLSNSKIASPPKYAIANGLFIGALPSEFDDTTPTENGMLNLGQPTHFLSVVRGNIHSTLRSHAHVFRARPSPPASMVPSDVLALGSFKVRMVGAMTPRQKAVTMKRYEVRSQRLKQQLQWYQEHNHKYNRQIVTVNENIINQNTCVVVDQTSREESENLPGRDAASDLDASTWRFNAPIPPHVLAHEDSSDLNEQVASSIINDFPRATESEDIQTALDPDVIVRRSSELLSDFDPNFWSYAFCELFPFGRGGLDEPRKVPIGLQEYIKHCLALSSRRFVKHFSFMLVAFDILARHRAMKAIQLTTRLSPNIAIGAATIHRDELYAHLKQRELDLQFISTNHTTRVQATPACRALNGGINAGLRAYWGSNQERLAARADVFALSSMFGQPSIFFTISPSSSSTYRIANLSGELSDTVAATCVHQLDACLAMSRAMLGRISSSAPTMCAKYFDKLMEIVIEVLIGWDLQLGKAGDYSGLFGRPDAFYGMTESQNSTGDLHAHMLIWISGLPTSVEEYYKKWENSSFRNDIMKYAESIVTNAIPHCSNMCPRCSQGLVRACPLTQAAFKKPKKDAQCPKTAQCDTCGASYGADILLQEQITARAELLGMSSASISNDMVQRYIASPLPLPLPGPDDDASSIIFAKTLLTYQNHYWFHAKSCFKPSGRIPKGDICRMFFPKEHQKEAHVTAEGEIALARPVGHEYLNGYSPTIAAIFRTNHDIKMLAAGEGKVHLIAIDFHSSHHLNNHVGPEKAYYMMKYTTKEQEQIENCAVIHLNAYDKAAAKFDDQTDQRATGTRRIMSMLSTLTCAQEIPAPQAGLCIERGSMTYTSHKFVKCFIQSLITAIELNIQTCTLRSNREVYEPSSTYEDYVHRPHELEQLAVSDFMVNWIKKRGMSGLKFDGNHHQSATHTMHKSSSPTCLTPVGKRLPNVNDPNVSQESMMYYVQTMMILFKPFRTRQQLLSTDDDWNSTYADWWPTPNAKMARQYSKYTLEYYTAKRMTRDRPDRSLSHYHALAMERDDETRDNVASETSSSDDEQCDADYLLEREEMDTDPTSSTITPTFAPLVENFEGSMNVISTISPQINFNQPVDISRLKSEIEQIDHDPTQLQNDPNPTIPQTDVTVDTRITILTNMDLNPTWRDHTHFPSRVCADLPRHASIQDVSEHFSLNKKQHVIFVQAGAALIQSFQTDATCRTAPPKLEQYRGFLAGLPGAGKSQVIKALQALSIAWDKADATKTVAFQGVATQAVDGETLHKCFGWRLNGIDEKWRPNHAQESKFAGMKLLIVDEISTTDAKFIGQMDICLRRIRHNDAVMGGIHFLFVGDWLQQLPVAGTPAFIEQVPQPKRPISTKNGRQQNAAYLQQLRGAWVYRQIDKVVVLDENMRHRGDPVWAAILNRWRIGNYVQADLDLVNQKCYQRNWTLEPADSNGDSFCPCVVTSNQLRYEFNNEAFRRYCTSTAARWHRFPAKLGKQKGVITPLQRKSLRSIRDDKTANLAMNFDVAIGMPVQCTKNISRSLRLANGTIGHIIFISAGSQNQVQMIQDEITGHPIHEYERPPDFVLIKIRGSEDRLFLPSLPPGIAPVFPHNERSVSIQLPNRRFSVTLQQIPLIQAYSITSDKSQGITVNQMVLGPLRHQTRKVPQRASFYVAVTRVRTMSRLYIMEPLTMDRIKYFTPPLIITNEIQRLHELSMRNS